MTDPATNQPCKWCPFTRCAHCKWQGGTHVKEDDDDAR